MCGENATGIGVLQILHTSGKFIERLGFVFRDDAFVIVVLRLGDLLESKVQVGSGCINGTCWHDAGWKWLRLHLGRVLSLIPVGMMQIEAFLYFPFVSAIASLTPHQIPRTLHFFSRLTCA